MSTKLPYKSSSAPGNSYVLSEYLGFKWITSSIFSFFFKNRDRKRLNVNITNMVQPLIYWARGSESWSIPELVFECLYRWKTWSQVLWIIRWSFQQSTLTNAYMWGKSTGLRWASNQQASRTGRLFISNLRRNQQGLEHSPALLPILKLKTIVSVNKLRNYLGTLVPFIFE